MVRNVRRLLVLAGAFSAVGSHLGAQQAGGAPGWVGIEFDVSAVPGGLGRDSVVRITNVSVGSPAEQAGIRKGDHLLAVGDLGGVNELRLLKSRLRLEAGDLITIRVERGGSPLQLTVRAAERPNEVEAGQTVTLTFRTDSIAETMFLAMDALRNRLVVATPPDQGADEPRMYRVGAVRGTPIVSGAPFEWLVFGGEDNDSLARELERVDGVLKGLQAEHDARMREMEAATARLADEYDARLVRIAEQIEVANRSAARLRATMREAALDNAGPTYVNVSAPAPSPATQPSEPFRPLSPYFLGSNRVAGAQLFEVGPDLAEYFQVTGGVLVMDVAPGTPAALSGLRAGDVVVRVDGRQVRTVEDMRLGVARAGDTLPISLVRRAESVELLLRRR